VSQKQRKMCFLRHLSEFSYMCCTSIVRVADTGACVTNDTPNPWSVKFVYN